MEIKDGAGTGNRVRVNPANQLEVRAVSLSDQQDISRTKGDAYMLPSTATAPTLTMATGNTHKFLILKNDESRTLVIDRFFISSDTAGLVCTITKNALIGTIATHAAETPVNQNFGSGKTATVTAYSWDETGTVGMGGITGGTTCTSMIMGAGVTRIMDLTGTNLAQDNTIMVTFFNGTGGNVEGSAHMVFHFIDDDV